MHNTNWNKKLSDPNSFNSSWDWTVSHSEYHFDTSVVEQHGDWYNVLGCFKGDWKADTDAIIKAAMPITWATRKYYKDNHDPSPMLTQEESDIRDVGVDPSKLMLTNMLEDLDSYPTLKKMCDHFGVTGNYKYRIHVQLTGQMFNTHIDKLWHLSYDDPEQVVRISIMLDDWKPGQFYSYGNHVYTGWKAGEAHMFDWANVPHSTANASMYARPLLQVTGLKTQKTRDIIANASHDTVFKL